MKVGRTVHPEGPCPCQNAIRLNAFDISDIQEEKTDARLTVVCSQNLV